MHGAEDNGFHFHTFFLPKHPGHDCCSISFPKLSLVVADLVLNRCLSDVCINSCSINHTLKRSSNTPDFSFSSCTSCNMENATLFQTPTLNLQHGAATVQAKAATIVSQVSNGLNTWTLVLSLLLAAIVYDQGREAACLHLLHTSLTMFQTARYIIQKSHLPGTTFKIPFAGPFLESIYPDFDKYLAKWDSGALSCVSVFHK